MISLPNSTRPPPTVCKISAGMLSPIKYLKAMNKSRIATRTAMIFFILLDSIDLNLLQPISLRLDFKPVNAGIISRLHLYLGNVNNSQTLFHIRNERNKLVVSGVHIET